MKSYEYFTVLKKLGVSPIGAKGGCTRYTRRMKLPCKLAMIGGALVVVSVIWAVDFDAKSRGILKATRREYASRYQDGQQQIILQSVVTFLVTTGGTQTYPIPQDWNNSANTIEAIGPGGNGGSNGVMACGGAGGGAYCKATNLQLIPRGTASYVVGTPGIDTWFKSVSDVLAKAGSNGAGATGGVGGAAAACVPSSGAFSGGAAGNGSGNGAGGGGGAAGPGGAGGAGADGTSAGGGSGGGGGEGGGNSGPGTAGSGTTGGSGGGGGQGGNGGNGGVSAPGNPGAAGTNFDGSHGAGGGGGGGGSPGVAAGAGGGLYGAGGGGATYGGTPGLGAQGLIIVTYTPAVTLVPMMMWKPNPDNLELRGHPSRKQFFIHGSPTMLRWRHLTAYFVYTPEPYIAKGPGATNIRKKEPKLQD